MAEKTTETPLMKQYYSFKAKYPDAMLLFRVGDFYETYGEDAVKSSKILGIVMAGTVVPIILAVLMPMFSLYSAIG